MSDTVHAIARRYAYYLEQSERSALTIKNYLSDLRGFARWFEEANGDPLTPDKITPIDLREYKGFLAGQLRLKPESIVRKLTALKSFLTWARQVGLVEGGRILRVPRTVRDSHRGPRWLDRREQNRFLRTLEQSGNVRDLAIVKLLLHTGLRVSELCALIWADVTVTERKGRLTVRNGKGGKHREIPLNKDARCALSSIGYAQHTGELARVFMGQRGPLTPRGVQSMFSKYVKAADLEGISPHSLRHTFCKNLVDAGVSLEKIAALAGHSSLEVTRRYCEPSLKGLEQTVGLIEEEP